ncbi:hypothetical protein CA13_08670 [Planctomycetes bacterium CA13]|uniref:Uncharacterized protein n=1 Tax=Novipirellula herctigrandis TaxID=2527986 RepID=A0A5C5YXG9_9BACT|nr:hypothetical protein CA13_08670 [Planctomycetes bacterium CA13]
MKNAIPASSRNHAVERLATAVKVEGSDGGTLDLPDDVTDAWTAILLDVHERRKIRQPQLYPRIQLGC